MKKVLLYAGMILALAAVSCNPAEKPSDPSKDPSTDPSENTTPSDDPSGNPSENVALKLTTESEITLEAEEAEMVTISFEAAGIWTASSDADWFVISPESGNGDGTINGVADDNEEPVDREATVTITSGSETITVKIIQAGIWAPYFDLLNEGIGQFSGYGEGDPLTVGVDGGVVILSFSTNLEWYYYLDDGTDEGTTDLGWISIKKEGNSLTVNIEPTDSYAERVEYIYVGCYLGDEDYNAHGACVLVKQDALSAPTTPTLLWTKSFAELSSSIRPCEYSRLAYSNDCLLLSDGSSVYVIDPEEGNLTATVNTAIPPHSIDSDDVGNLIIMSDVTSEIEEGQVVGPKDFTIYWTPDINSPLTALYTFDYSDQAWGTVGNFRIRGDLIAGKAVVTAAVGSSRFYYGWAFENGDYYNPADLEPIRSSLAYGNINTDGNTPDQIGVIPVSADNLLDGILTRGYMCYYNGTGWDGARQVWLRVDPSVPHWSEPAWTQVIPNGYGDGGNECQGNIDVLQVGEKRILAYTQGQHFTWGYGEANIYVFDITDLNNASIIANISPEEWIGEHELSVDAARGADVLLRENAGNVELYVVHAYGQTVAKYVFRIY